MYLFENRATHEYSNTFYELKLKLLKNLKL